MFDQNLILYKLELTIASTINLIIKKMTTELKAILIIVLITIVVIVGGLYLTKDGPKSPNITINQDTLVSADNPRKTGANAKVQIVEFADFACPACAVLEPNLEAALAEYKDSVDFVLRLIPIHAAESYDSATAAFAAGEQGKLFEMGSILFAKQSEWTNKGNKRELFIGYAQSLGLDVARFTAAYDSKELKSKVKGILDKDSADSSAMRISSTPTLVINGTAVVGVQSVETLKAMIQSEIDKASGTIGTSTFDTVDSSTPIR